MTFAIVALATARYRTSADADELSKRLMERLGLAKHYVPARLAMACSLAVAEQPPAALGDAGRQIAGDALFGGPAELAVWVSLLIEHAGRAPDDEKEFQRWVAAHWARGLAMLSERLDAAGEDGAAFWRAIAETLPRGERGGTASPTAGIAGELGQAVAMSVPIGPVSIDAATGGALVWHVNAGGSSPHAAVMGGVGSGKTRTAIAMLR
ncbi:MAG: DndE family protein, partial [Fimbriimonadaceae bacterium]|nr:DndE family protein [Fimbriimonadaceae bacterium]